MHVGEAAGMSGMSGMSAKMMLMRHYESLVVGHTSICSSCRVGWRRRQGAQHSRGERPTRIGNAAIVGKPPADTENWGAVDHWCLVP